jgi:HEAT repeat protein
MPMGPAELARSLAAVEASDEAAVIHQLLPLTLSGDQQTAAAAATALVTRLDRLSPTDLARLDSTIRSSSSWFEPSWPDLKTFQGITRHGPVPAPLIGLASMHPSGYVREAAIRRLDGYADGTELPYLLIRLNDWVSPVREAAQAALRPRLQLGYDHYLVRNLTLVLRLADCGRDDHAPFVRSVLELLAGPESRPALLEGLASADRGIRRACYRLTLEATDIPAPEALRGAMRDRDPLVRLWAARTARGRLARDDFLALLPVLQRDRSAAVRREALRGLVEKDPDSAAAASRVALLDQHASIREAARYYLGKRGGFDFRSFYRDAVVSVTPDVLPAAVAGLGETGTEEDAGLILPRISHPVIKIRRSAVRALGLLAGDTYAGTLLRVLEDDRPSVTHAAREALRTRLALVSGEELWSVFQRDRRPHVRGDVLALLAGLGKWRSLAYLIRACSDQDSRIASKARDVLGAWLERFNRSFTAPTPSELQRAAEALESSRPSLAPEVVDQVLFSLKGW